MATEKSDDEARARALALLEATHQFPCAYAVTVIAFNRDEVTSAVKRAAGSVDEVAAVDDAVSDADVEADAAARYESRASKEGKYLSHRFAVHCKHADEVLELYARLRTIDGVVTIL